MEKIYVVKEMRGTLICKTKEKVGTLEELSKEYALYLGGVKPRKASSLEKRLNDSQKGKEGTYTYTTFFVKEVK